MSTTDGDRDVVLVVTARSDETGDAVETELEKHDCTVARIDVGDFPAHLSATFTHDGTGWQGRLWNGEVSVDVERVRSVYYRRPTHFTFPPGLSGADADFVVQPDGCWRFLECNPNGQWLWLQHEAGLPIAAALAELLADGTGHLIPVGRCR